MGSHPMLDANLLRERPEVIRENLVKRGDTARIPVLENAIRWDREWREGQQELDRLRHLRNVVSQEIRELKKAGRDPAGKIREAAELPDRINTMEARVADLQKKLRDAMLRLPNLLHKSVPTGATEAENIEVVRGGPRKAPKSKTNPRGEFADALGPGDLERGRKPAGAGFVSPPGVLARLDAALLRFGIDFLVKRGFT